MATPEGDKHSQSWLENGLISSGLVPENYVKLGVDATKARESRIKHLLTHVSGIL